MRRLARFWRVRKNKNSEESINHGEDANPAESSGNAVARKSKQRRPACGSKLSIISFENVRAGWCSQSEKGQTSRPDNDFKESFRAIAETKQPRRIRKLKYRLKLAEEIKNGGDNDERRFGKCVQSGTWGQIFHTIKIHKRSNLKRTESVPRGRFTREKKSRRCRTD